MLKGAYVFVIPDADPKKHRAKILTASTGVPYSTEEMLKAGERIWNLEKLWNLKVGYTKKDDTLPARMSEMSIADGREKGY